MPDSAHQKRRRGGEPGARLAVLSLNHPRRTLALLGLLIVVAAVLGGSVASMLQAGSFADPHSETIQASDRVERATGVAANASIVVLVRPGGPVTTGPGLAEVQSVSDRLRSEARVATVLGPGTPGSLGLISRDGTEAYLVATIRDGSPSPKERAQQIQADLASDPAVLVGGSLIANRQVSDTVTKDIGRAEVIAFPILFVVLVVVLRGVVIAFLPLAVGFSTILITFLGLRAVNSLTDISIYAVNLVTGLSLGLAIDYGLLTLYRYREEARVDGYGRPALQRTLGTAGRTVLFSSLTVTAAMAALLLFPQQFLYSMGVGGVIGAPVAGAVALTLLPAALLVLGPRVETLGWFRLGAPQADDSGAWFRLARVVMRRPAIVAGITAAALLLIGTPFLRLSFTSVDASVLPVTTSARQVDDAIRADFSGEAGDPLRIVIAAPSGDPLVGARIAAATSSFGSLPGAAGMTPPRDLGGSTWEVDVVPAHPSLSAQTQTLLTGIRAAAMPYPTQVTGSAAAFADLQSSLASHLVPAGLLVAVTTIVVLFAMTGSAILPIKAVLMNALSLAAAFGLLVLIFQDGRLTGLLRYTPQGGLESTQPVLLFAIAFGLSTDYGVFLLGRIKEGHDAGMSTSDAVSRGMQRTGRIVTAAALLFCIAIGAFATSNIVFIKELGVGTALAVFLDATVVRALLVPSLMAIMGEWNWWAPRPLRALHRRLGFDRLETSTATDAASLRL